MTQNPFSFDLHDRSLSTVSRRLRQRKLALRRWAMPLVFWQVAKPSSRLSSFPRYDGWQKSRDASLPCPSSSASDPGSVDRRYGSNSAHNQSTGFQSLSERGMKRAIFHHPSAMRASSSERMRSVSRLR